MKATIKISRDEPGPTVDQSRHKRKNLGYMFAVLLLWVSARFLYVRVLGGAQHEGGFVQFDILFVFLPPVGAFFLNWYWMREQRTDMIRKWTLGWALINLAVLLVVILVAGNPLHQLFLQLR